MNSLTEQRIFDCINFDKKKNPEGLNDLVKIDIIKVLNNYFEIEEENTLIKTEVCSDGSYSIKLVSKAKSVKTLNFLK